MTRLQKSILRYMRYTPRTLKAARRHVRFLHPCWHISDYAFNSAIESLEDNDLIEELGNQELLARKRGKDYSGVVDDFSGKYIATDEFGIECADEIISESAHFWIPVFLSAVSLVISVVSLILSR